MFSEISLTIGIFEVPLVSRRAISAEFGTTAFSEIGLITGAMRKREAWPCV